MSKRRFLAPTAALLAPLALALALSAAPEVAADEGAPNEAAAAKADTAAAREAWRTSCQRCHTVPDATFETDRAFLAQITETS